MYVRTELISNTMKKVVTPSDFRANLYRFLDEVLESGEPIEILRKGRKLKVVPEFDDRLERIKPHPEYLKGSVDDIVHMDWSGEWRP